MANPFQDDIVKRINRTTGVTGGRQYSTPLPADKIPKPNTSLVPTGQGSIPPVREGVSVKDGFFRQAKPNFTTAPNYKGTIPPNRSLTPTQAKVSSGPAIDPYTGESIKPAFQGAKSFAKGMGNQVKSALKGSFADPTFLYGMADSANQTALEQNIEQGDLGIGDAARLMFSGASRFPRIIAEQASGQSLTPATQESGQGVTSAQASQSGESLSSVSAVDGNARSVTLPSNRDIYNQPFLSLNPNINPMDIAAQDDDGRPANYTQSDTGLPYRQGEGGRIEFTNPNGTGRGTMDFGSPEANARMAAKFKDGKGGASFTDLSGMGSSPYRDQQPAPQQQGIAPQYIMPRVPDNSEYINSLMQQLARPARSGRFTDMIADKKNRENLKASLNAALGLQKEQSDTAMNQARLAADQQQFNAQMAMAQSKEERDAIQQEWNNYMETMKFGSGIMKDRESAQAATEQQNYNRFKDSRDYGLRERKSNQSQSSNVDTNAAQALAKIYSNDEQEAATATDYLTKYYPQVYAKYVKQGY